MRVIHSQRGDKSTAVGLSPLFVVCGYLFCASANRLLDVVDKVVGILAVELDIVLLAEVARA
jgi:uncharacterized protein YunC (DUF1805 family)